MKISDMKYENLSLFLVILCVYMDRQSYFNRHSLGIQMHLNCVFEHHICPCEFILGCLLSLVGYLCLCIFFFVNF